MGENVEKFRARWYGVKTLGDSSFLIEDIGYPGVLSHGVQTPLLEERGHLNSANEKTQFKRAHSIKRSTCGKRNEPTGALHSCVGRQLASKQSQLRVAQGPSEHGPRREA